MNPLDLLTGPGAGDLLSAAVSASGGRLGDWQVGQIDHRPGDLTTVSYRARVVWPDGERDDVLAATGGPGATAEPGVLTLSDGEQTVSVWCVPHDPDLPALAAALDPARLEPLLASFGVPASGLTCRLIAYRPRRRAVVVISAGATRFYLKVLPPGEAEGLHRRHRLLHEAGVPVPPSLGYSDDGLLMLGDRPGTGLRTLLTVPTSKLPDAGQLVGLLDRFPAAISDLPRRAPWSRLGDRYASVIGDALPPERERAARIARAVRSGLAGKPPGDEPTHGDLYEAQLIVDDGRITGLLDVDTAGPGDRADDLACALAHCDALALSRPRDAGTVTALGAHWQAGFERTVDPADLALRTAGVLLSLATGPHRVQRPGWERATSRFLDAAERRLPR